MRLQSKLDRLHEAVSRRISSLRPSRLGSLIQNTDIAEDQVALLDKIVESIEALQRQFSEGFMQFKTSQGLLLSDISAGGDASEELAVQADFEAAVATALENVGHQFDLARKEISAELNMIGFNNIELDDLRPLVSQANAAIDACAQRLAPPSESASSSLQLIQNFVDFGDSAAVELAKLREDLVKDFAELSGGSLLHTDLEVQEREITALESRLAKLEMVVRSASLRTSTGIGDRHRLCPTHGRRNQVGVDKYASTLFLYCYHVAFFAGRLTNRSRMTNMICTTPKGS